MINCPVCEHNEYKVKYVINCYKIMQCNHCNHYYTGIKLTNKRINNIYSDHYFFGGRAGYPDYFLEKEIQIKRGEKYAEIVNKYTTTGKLLDVGAAAGFIMKGFENKGWESSGIDPNKTMAEYGNTELNLDIQTGTMQNTHFDEKFDLIVLIQVVAHLNNINESFEIINNLINQEGLILIETWDKDSISAKLFGKNWHEYNPPSTLNFFGKKSLDTLMERYGFKKVAVGRPGKKIHGKHAKELVRYKLGRSKNIKWLKGIERVIPSEVYLPYPAEDLFWALYQKQI